MPNDALPNGRQPKLALVTRDVALKGLLTALLEEWHHPVLDQPDENTLVLVEEGCPAPRRCAAVIPMNRSPLPEGAAGLSLPLAVEELWAVLEPYFHKPARRHIRIPQNRLATVTARGQSETTHIVSLSDLGTRFSLRRELVNDEALELELKLGGVPWHLRGRVIYVLPRGDYDGSGLYDIGMLFVHEKAASRQSLLAFIIASYLRRVAQRLSPAAFRAGLDQLFLSPPLQALLADA